MDAIVKTNQQAWEEAFDRRETGFGNDHAQRLLAEDCAFIDSPVKEALEGMQLAGTTIGQLCCNNGRELMSLVKHHKALEGVGFDVAGNILAQAREIAHETQIPCTFVQGDVCAIADDYAERFDLLVMTIGALCWIESPEALFTIAAKLLKPGAYMVIHEAHPLSDMFGIEGDDGYDPSRPEKLVYSYFKDDPFVDTTGMGYLTGTAYQSKPFTSFHHTMGSLLTAMATQGLYLQLLREFDVDLGGSFDALSGKGLPLSYMLVAQKKQ